MIYFLHTLKRFKPGSHWIPANSIKIGYTKNLIQRVTEQISRDFLKVELLGFMDGDLTLEMALHQRFKDSRAVKSGVGTHYCDWYHATQELVEFIRQNARLDRQVAERLFKSRAFHLERPHGYYLAQELSEILGVQRGVILTVPVSEKSLTELIEAGQKEFEKEAKRAWGGENWGRLEIVYR